MNKLELIAKLEESQNLSKPQTAKIVDEFFNEMAEALARGDRVEIRGLCAMHIKNYESYVGRNPKTGEKTIEAPKKLPFFKCGRDLKKRLNRAE